MPSTNVPRFVSLRCLLLLLLLFCVPQSLPAAAQASVEGQVVAAGTDEPIAAAQILLRSAGQEIVFRAHTDAQGAFRFPVVEPGDYHLFTEAQGYFPVEYELVVKPRHPVSLIIELVASQGETQEVVVQASYADLDPAQTGTSRVLTRQRLQALPSPLRRDIPTLVENVAPGAVLSHDNFVHIRGNELSLHQFINGVSFLDNSHQHFTPGLSPQIFESVNIITGGFPAEFGNRFGGILDIATRSGRTLNGHGSAALGLGTVLNRDAAVDYGGHRGRLGYYFFVTGFESDRFLNPPTRRAAHDFGSGLRSTLQLDYQGEKNLVKLLLTGGGTRFQLPNTQQEERLGRDAARRIRSQTLILNWQHIFSAHTLLATSVYERNVSDRLLATSDPLTLFGAGARSTLTTGVKSDLTYARGGHTLKGGIDLTLFRLRESFRFAAREEQAAGSTGTVSLARAHPPLPFPLSSSSGLPEAFDEFSFRGRDRGGQVSLYLQDRFSPFRHFTVDAGVRWDQINLVDSYFQVSPRLGLAYHVPPTGSVVHFSYNRFFVPPPLEYVILASFLGNATAPPDHQVGNVRPYTQNYYELGWTQQLHAKLFLEVNAYTHRGKNAFETAELSNTRLFLPMNFHRARASGAELALVLRPLERIGLSGRFQYAVSRVHFFGPISGGVPGEDLAPGERILPAFDQTHTGTARIFYRHPWHSFWSGFIFRYGSGTPVEEEVELNGQEFERVVRLPQHLTADFSAGLTLRQKESHRLELEFNVTNLSNNIYRIGKESQATPVQFAPRRVVSGRLTWRF